MSLPQDEAADDMEQDDDSNYEIEERSHSAEQDDDVDDHSEEYEESETVVLIDFPEKGPQPWGASAEVSLIDFASATPRIKIGEHIYHGNIRKDVIGTTLLFSREMARENGKDFATGSLQAEGFCDTKMSFRKVRPHVRPQANPYKDRVAAAATANTSSISSSTSTKR